MKYKGLKVYLCVKGGDILEKMGLQINNIRVPWGGVQCRDFLNKVMNLLFL